MPLSRIQQKRRGGHNSERRGRTLFNSQQDDVAWGLSGRCVSDKAVSVVEYDEERRKKQRGLSES